MPASGFVTVVPVDKTGLKNTGKQGWSSRDQSPCSARLRWVDLVSRHLLLLFTIVYCVFRSKSSRRDESPYGVKIVPSRDPSPANTSRRYPRQPQTTSQAGVKTVKPRESQSSPPSVRSSANKNSDLLKNKG